MLALTLRSERVQGALSGIFQGGLWNMMNAVAITTCLRIVNFCLHAVWQKQDVNAEENAGSSVLGWLVSLVSVVAFLATEFG